MLPELNEAKIAELLPLPAADWLASVHIFQGQFAVSYRERERIVRKLVSPEAVLQCFSQIPVDTGFLPPGTVRWGIAGGEEWAAKFIPPGRYSLSFANGNQLTLPLPGFLFCGLGRSYYLWAVKTKQFAPELRLFHAPLPNINNSGGICFGNVSVPPASLSNLDRAWQVFIGSEFNQDLTQGKSKQHRKNAIAQLQAVAADGCQSYPRRDLVPCQYPYSTRPLTAAEAIANLVKSRI
jgi:hypothetical protein